MPAADKGAGKDPDHSLLERVRQHLEQIYPQLDCADGEALAARCLQQMGLSAKAPGSLPMGNLWSESDIVLISYGDSLRQGAEVPLRTLHNFLLEHLADVVSTLHILPFYPWTSDDGFAVSDYRSVNPALGRWEDIEALSHRFRLIADCVINHCSSEHPWFKQFEADELPGRDYFLAVDADQDLSAVVRPRTSPLLRPTSTKKGIKQVWCTFGHDQIDLNFASPALLMKILSILRSYLDRGVRGFRLDAVGFVWKQLGTGCLNLPTAHEIVRLIRTLTEQASPETWILTETNVPVVENLAYFGNSNEAHLIYNFPLPPLLLQAVISGSSKHLRAWMMSMPPAREGTTYLNFVASHDGIGLRPAEGLLSLEERDQLIETLQSFGGLVSSRRLADGTESPYEINISLIDACSGTHSGADEWQIDRFTCIHAITMGLEGIPAIYLHSWLATPNDLTGLARTGRARSINRKQLELSSLQAQLSDPNSMSARILVALKKLARIRRKQPAFHPNATQFTLQLDDKLFGFWRQSRDRQQCIFCIHNLTAEPQSLRLSELNLTLTENWWNLLDDRALSAGASLDLKPYESAWISNRNHN